MIKQKETIVYGHSSLSFYTNDEVSADFRDSLFFGELKVELGSDFSPLIEKLKSSAVKKNKTRLIGPINGSTYFDYRLKMNFFSEPSYVGEPENPSEVQGYFEQAGFKVLKMYYSHEFKILNSWMFRWLGIFGSVARLIVWMKGYRIKCLKKSDLRENSSALHSIVHDIFGSNFLYSPISDLEFSDLVEKKYIPYVDEFSSQMLMSPGGECVGFNLCLHDERQPHRVLFKAHGVRRDHRLKGLASLCLMAKSWLRLSRSHRTCLACLTVSGSRVDDHFHRLAFKRYDYGLYELSLLPSTVPN